MKTAEEYLPIVAHVVIKSKMTELLLENLCGDWRDEMYIDYEQSLMSYVKERDLRPKIQTALDKTSNWNCKEVLTKLLED